MTNVASVAGVNADEYWDKGFTIVRGLYSAEEISDFRKRSLASVGKHGGDLLSHPELRSVITDGRLLDVARQILKRDDVVYYGDSLVAIREGTPGFHKDNTDKFDGKAPDWAVVRLSVVKPLVEVRQSINDELARRNSQEALVPLDRDPVPNRYSELVRKYYEELGKDK